MTNKEKITKMGIDELAELLTPKRDCRECILSRDVCDRYYEQDPSQCIEKVKKWLETEIVVKVTEIEKEKELDFLKETRNTELITDDSVYLIATAFSRDFEIGKETIAAKIVADTKVLKTSEKEKMDVTDRISQDIHAEYSTKDYYSEEQEIIRIVNSQHETVIMECRRKLESGIPL